MSYGLEVYNKNGEVILDNERLTHRFVDKIEVDSTGDYYFKEYLDHKPTVLDYTLTLYSYKWEFITDNGQYQGISLSKINNDYDYSIDGITIYLIFARE